MAALLIAAGIALVEKVDQKRQARKDKKLQDELRYKELQHETMARSGGGGMQRRDSESDSEDEGARRIRRERKTEVPSPPSSEMLVQTIGIGVVRTDVNGYNGVGAVQKT
ncbi:hypothetical protein LTR86_000908 [Recurvomyces mirabilis]|nr:hypothetical protein LTR86_000908 [Recurvomyces mirabilis]